MLDKPANKHEMRTRETRALLLQAAETVFVRDGYEGAELGEIAALADRTKGAIYAHFESKEDIFLALIEERTNCKRAQMEKILANSTSIEENMAAVRNFFVQSVGDKAWTLLILEFKIFAMRHPESKKRLQSLYEGLFYQTDEKRLVELLGAAAKGKDAISREIAIKALQPVIGGLVLESHLDSAMANPSVMRKLAGRMFDALMDLPAR